MIFLNVTIRSLPQRRLFKLVLISANLWSEMGIDPKAEYVLKVGMRTQRVKVNRLPDEITPTILLSRDLFSKFGLTGQNPVNVKLSADPPLIELGPVIGVFTGSNKQGRKDFARIYRNFFDVAQQEGAILYFFRTKDVNPRRLTIKGFKYQQKWLQQRYPFPDVVYDQIRSRKTENSTQVIRIKTILQHYCSGYFNLGFMNKWQVYQVLVQIPSVKVFLPPTNIYRGVETVLQMLAVHPVVYVKPANGSLGQGIIKIERVSAGFCWQWAARRQPVRKIITSTADLDGLLQRIIKRKTYVVQQGLNLLTVNDRPADIRILMQKDENGQWQETHRFAKVAIARGIATNVAMGGMVIEVAHLLQAAIDKYGINPTQVEINLRQLQRAVCAAMDESKTGLGEMGLDVGIDQSGQVWLIEANAKYSRHVFPQSVKELSIRRPISFAKWLTGW